MMPGVKKMSVAAKSYGWVGRILWVNLTERSFHTLDTSAYGPTYIGGRGIAARIAWESIPRGVGALDPENLLMFFTGPLSGTTAPFSGRTAITGLSPQGWPHEWFGRSNIGGHWGPSLKYAGYDGLVIQGKAEAPAFLWIDNEKVEILDAGHLWGHGSIETQQLLFDELGKDIRVLTIGQAGERMSRISSICTGTNSAAGQGGFGAVMGSKNLKAIAVRGTGPIYVARPGIFVDQCRAIVHEARTGSRFHNPQLDPVREEKYDQRFTACTQGCAVCCGGSCRFYTLTAPLSKKRLAGQFHCVSNFFPGIPNSFYDWKLDFEAAFEVKNLADEYGLNHWDLLLGLVPWLRLCKQSGVIDKFNGLPIDFDSPEFWVEFLKAITYREGMGDALAEGGKRAPAILNFGQDLADPLYAAWGSAGHWDGHGDRGNRVVFPFWLPAALQWAVDVRDPFSSSHGYAALAMHWSPFLNQDGLSWDAIKHVGKTIYGSEASIDPESAYQDKEIPAVWHGNRSVMKDSVPVDDNMFPMLASLSSSDGLARTGSMQGPDFEYHLFVSATGCDISRDEFERACERIFTLERAIQVRNFDRCRQDDECVIPYFERIEWWENPLHGEKKGLDPQEFLVLLDKYYRLRGWDEESGRPTVEKLIQLGLPDVAAAIGVPGKLSDKTINFKNI